MRNGLFRKNPGRVATNVVLILCCLAFSSSAQVFYSTNPEYLSIKKEQNNLLSRFRYQYPDTIVTNLANYFPRNFLGNMGLASPQYQLQYGTDPLGFRLWKTPLENDRIYDQQVEYYRTKGPYADLTGIAGSKQFQIFKALFTHTFRDKINVTLRFNRYTSTGFYQKQQTYTNNFFLSSNYSSSNKRLGYYLYLLNNGNKGSENGGIRDGQLNDSTMKLNKELMLVNLSQASRDNRETKIMFNPWLRLNKGSDSTLGGDHYLQLKSKTSFQSNRYKDAGIAVDSFYKAFYVDTVQTIDSAHVLQFRNELNYAWLGKNGFGFSIGYTNEVNKVHQFFDSLFIHHIVGGDFQINRIVKTDTNGKVLKRMVDNFTAEYIAVGPNAGNYRLENRLEWVFNEQKNQMLYLKLLAEKRSADYIYNNWLSNHFYWFNKGFIPQQQLQAKAGLRLGSDVDVSLFAQSISNYLYFDTLATPAQFRSSVTNFAVQINYTKILFKHLGIGLSLVHQNSSSSEVVRLPANIGTGKLFYHGNLFRNNLQLQFGAQVQMYEGFYSYAYMPSTQVFYLQNGFKTQAYPYVDVFLQARIRPVSFFLKLENAIQGLAGPNYAFTPGYYQTDRAFRFGINWVFFD